MNAQRTALATATTQIVQAASGAGFEVIVETPIAVSFNGTTAAVMMGTPNDLRDLAFGFALTEGYIKALNEVESFEEVSHEKGFEARFWVSAERSQAIAARRRAMAGPVGCGLCGLESLEEVTKPLPKVTGTLAIADHEIPHAMARIQDWQPLKKRSRSTHAAGFYVPGQGMRDAREDVGRHNALDKLVGTLVQQGVSGDGGAVVVTSRLSLELVQKCAILGAPMLIAASGPTSLAIATARDCGIRLIGFCRGANYEVFC